MAYSFIVKDIGGAGKEWSLDFSVLRDCIDNGFHRCIYYQAETEEEGLIKALDILKRSIIRTKEHKQNKPLTLSVLIIAKKIKEDKGEFFDELYRIKTIFENQRLLCIKNPEKIFVKGYGSEALKQLGKGLYRRAKQN